MKFFFFFPPGLIQFLHIVTWDFDPPIHRMSSCTESPHPFPLRTLPFLVTQSFLVTRTTRLPLSRLLRSCLKCGATVQAGASHCFKANTDRYLTEGRLVQGSSSSLKTKTQANHPSDCDRPTIRVAAPGGKECVFLHQIP